MFMWRVEGVDVDTGNNLCISSLPCTMAMFFLRTPSFEYPIDAGFGQIPAQAVACS